MSTRGIVGGHLRLHVGEQITVFHQPEDSIEPWLVMRGRGRDNELVEEAVIDSLSYSPFTDRWFVNGPIVSTGAQFRVVQ